MTPNRIYLGDGVYVEFTGYDFVLKTQREDEHYIHLEPEAIRSLVNFAKLKGVVV